MSKKKKVVVTTSKKSLQPTKSRVGGTNSSSSTKSSSGNRPMLFKKKNYQWMLAGIGLIALGIILMAGGHMPDENTWDPDIIYSFRRITLAPIIILTGLAFQIVAIFKK